MTQQSDTNPSDVAAAAVPPLPCPQCARPMGVRPTQPTLLLAADPSPVIYVCERCGVEAKRVG
jgi:hypothetical protein